MGIRPRRSTATGWVYSSTTGEWTNRKAKAPKEFQGLRIGLAVKGLEENQQRLQRLVDAVGNGARDIIDKLAATIAFKAKQKAPSDTGRLRGSIRANKTRDTTYQGKRRINAWVKAGARQYGRYVEFGTITQKSRKAPPVGGAKSISRWAKRHGLNPWAVARKIAGRGSRTFTYQSKKTGTSITTSVKGSKKQPFMYATYYAHRQAYFNQIKAMLQREIKRA